jgi:hypothetical protein
MASASKKTTAIKRTAALPAARYGVWWAWAGCCAWCQEPIRFPDCEVDHVIPLHALNSIGAEQLRTRYQLANDFDFDDFPNWVPTHPGCNGKKRQLVFNASPELLLHLAVVQSKAAFARSTAEAIQNDRKSARTFAKLASLIEAGTVSKADLEDFLAGLPLITKKGISLPDEHMFIASSWEIIRSGDGGSIRVNSTPQAGTAFSSTSWKNFE